MLSDPACTRCPLHTTAKSVCIPGRGADAPRVLFVGQAPGGQEDIQGKCFVGPAGEVLLEAIKEYIRVPYRLTNTVKCFPPGDRDPHKAEIQACSGFLQGEIEHYKPEFIVTLGNIPLKALTGKTGITDLTGRVVGQVQGSKVFALLHPSFILRYPKHQARFEAGFKELGYLLGQEVRPEIPTFDEVNPEEFANYWCARRKSCLAFDFETNGTAKRDGGRLRSVALSDGETAVWMNLEKHGAVGLHALAEFLKSDVEKAAHNLGFEMNWCFDQFGFEPQKLRWDTMLLHFLGNENTAHNLESVAIETLGAAPWDVWPEMKEQGWTYESVPIEKVGPYNAQDAYWTAKLIVPLWMKLDEELRTLYKNVVRPQAKVCARLERRGIFIDGDYCRRVDAIFAADWEKLGQELLKHAAVRKVAKEVEAGGKEFNLNSAHHLRRVFYDKLRLPVLEETDTGLPSVREPVLERIKNRNPVVGQYLDWKEKDTIRERFLRKFPAQRDAYGLVHGSFNPARVVTGRLAVTDPPLQTLPAKDIVRGMITSRFPGGQILSADYKQLEVRLVASEADEEKLLAAIAEGADLHNLTAKLLFGENFTKEQRGIAKRINFGIVYGISPFSLAAEFNMSTEEAEGIFARFRQVYPKIFHWMNIQHAHLRKYGWVRTRFGRVRRLPEIVSADERQAARMLRQAGNFPIQSAGADITNTAMCLTDRALRKGGYKTLLIHQIHDSLLCDVPPTETQTITPLIVDLMTKEVQARCPWLRVKLEVDTTLEARWGGYEFAEDRACTNSA